MSLTNVNDIRQPVDTVLSVPPRAARLLLRREGGHAARSRLTADPLPAYRGGRLRAAGGAGARRPAAPPAGGGPAGLSADARRRREAVHRRQPPLPRAGGDVRAARTRV